MFYVSKKNKKRLIIKIVSNKFQGMVGVSGGTFVSVSHSVTSPNYKIYSNISVWEVDVQMVMLVLITQLIAILVAAKNQ